MAFLSVSRNSVARRRKAWRRNLETILSGAVLVRLDDWQWRSIGGSSAPDRIGETLQSADGRGMLSAEAMSGIDIRMIPDSERWPPAESHLRRVSCGEDHPFARHRTSALSL
jgi:hypothetical protein